MSDLRTKLEEIRDELISKKREYVELSVKKKDGTKLLSECAKEIKVAISEEVDDKGKPKYSNQQKRDNAFIEKTETDKYYVKASRAIDKLDKKLKDLEIDIEELKYTFKIEDILTRGDF